jgi:NAD(P)-dependent dehydrogenase (short-subunit alcohol dehydrogenase family)
MPTLLVTGANRGLGLEFVRQYAADGWRVVACARQPGTATELAALAARHPARRACTRSTSATPTRSARWPRSSPARRSTCC